MKLLNLYAGELGGDRKKFKDVEVTAVENNEDILNIYSNLFPSDGTWLGDAHLFLKENYKEYDFIWSSPPCQSHSRMMKATRHDVAKYPDLKLYEEIIFLKHFFKGLWVVENVIPYYKPLIGPSIIIDRHCFWSNFKITQFNYPKKSNLINTTTVKGAEELKKWLGKEYEGNLYIKGSHHPTQALRNCVHPDLGLHILNCALNIENVTQQTIFI